MKYAYIGRETAGSLPEIYDILCEAFSFPSYFGRNLDALYDCLTDISEPSVIILADPDVLSQAVGGKWNALMLCIEDACKNNPNLIKREVL